MVLLPLLVSAQWQVSVKVLLEGAVLSLSLIHI
jgi:hypothetical protein